MNKQQQVKLNNLVRSDTWDLVCLIANKLIEKYEIISVVGQTEFETIKRAVERDAKKETIKEFLITIEQEANQD